MENDLSVFHTDTLPCSAQRDFLCALHLSDRNHNTDVSSGTVCLALKQGRGKDAMVGPEELLPIFVQIVSHVRSSEGSKMACLNFRRHDDQPGETR